MRIENIDKNFAHSTVVTKDGMTEYPIPNENFALYGIFYDEKEGRFARMDIAVANEVVRKSRRDDGKINRTALIIFKI